MLGLMRDGQVKIEDHLVDNSNRPIIASVNFEVRYSSPESTEGNFDSLAVSKYVQQQADSLDEDQQILNNIEQNIANLEKSLNQGKLAVKICSFAGRFPVHASTIAQCNKNLFLNSSPADVEHKKQNIFQRALGGDKNQQSSTNNNSNNKMKVKKNKGKKGLLTEMSSLWQILTSGRRKQKIVTLF